MTISQIAKARTICVQEKDRMVQRVSALNLMLKSPGTSTAKLEYTTERSELLEKMTQVEAQIIKLNEARKSITVPVKVVEKPVEVKNVAPVQREPDPLDPEAKRDLVTKLVALRNEYEEFAADHSRVSSRRQMAAEFSMKLGRIIRQTISKNAGI